MAVDNCAQCAASGPRPRARHKPAMWSSVSATTTGERRRRWNRAGLRSVRAATAGAAGVTAGATGRWAGRQVGTGRGVRRERRDLLAQVGMFALGTQVRLTSVQDDGFEAMTTVVAAIFEEGHDLHSIGKTGQARR